MAKKRKCRLTADELDIHKRAVNLRKMTDEQLISYIEELSVERQTETAQNGEASAEVIPTMPAIETLLDRLAGGCVRGIGVTTALKIRDFAESEGLLT